MHRDPAFDFDRSWEHANDKERRAIIEDTMETVTIHVDRLEVTVTCAPPIPIEIDKAGLRAPGAGGRRRH